MLLAVQPGLNFLEKGEKTMLQTRISAENLAVGATAPVSPQSSSLQYNQFLKIKKTFSKRCKR